MLFIQQNQINLSRVKFQDLLKSPMFGMLLRLLVIFRLSSDNFYPDFGRLGIVIMEKPRITKKNSLFAGTLQKRLSYVKVANF